ncbi:MAG: hypothetical protein U0872_12150 [Planctomycetaceae bacterium]
MTLSASISAIMLRGWGLLALAAFTVCSIQFSFAPRAFTPEFMVLSGCLLYFAIKSAYVYAVSRSTWTLKQDVGAWIVLWQSKFGIVRMAIPLASIVRADANEDRLVILLKDENGVRAEVLLNGCAAADVTEAASLMNPATSGTGS